MRFTMKDFQEVAIAAFVSTLFFFALKRGTEIAYPYISPYMGILITLIWVLLHVNHSYTYSKVIPTFLVTTAICIVSALMFDLIKTDQIFQFNFFGSIVIIAVWIAFPIAIIFEKMNITNPVLREYIRKR